MSLLHLAFEREWAAALRAQYYVMSTRGASIDDVGFLHACLDELQLRGVADRLYADVTDPLVVLTLDEDALARHGLEVRVEPAEPDDPHSERFPHVYGGPLPVEVVQGVRPYHLAG